jgi:hypothetical protein
LEYNKEQESKIETAEMTILRVVASYTRKGQIRNTNIMKELSTVNQNNRIVMSRSQWKHQF